MTLKRPIRTITDDMICHRLIFHQVAIVGSSVVILGHLADTLKFKMLDLKKILNENTHRYEIEMTLQACRNGNSNDFEYYFYLKMLD